MEATEMNVVLARHDERIKDLEEWKVEQSETLLAIRNELKEFGRRPTWATTTIVGILSSLCSGMAMYIITNL